MKSLTLAAATMMCALFATTDVAVATEVVATDEFQLDIGGRAQLYGFGQIVDDVHRNDARLYLFMKQARLTLSGRAHEYRYHVQLAFAGEEEVRAPNPGVSLNLLDMSFDIPLGSRAGIRLGQFKVPYGRERLANPASLQFADRSIQNLAFRIGRDVGAAVHARSGDLITVLGIFTGGGRDVPERFLPQNLGFPLTVLRIGIDGGLDDDPFALTQSTLEVQRVRAALFLNGLYIRDSLIGHSTVLNVKTAEKSLLVSNIWNPYVGRRPLDRGTLWQGGADVVLVAPVGNFALSAEAEANYARYSNEYGNLELVGGRAQAGVHREPVGFALRYAVLFPDQNFANAGIPITGDNPIHEVTPAFTFFLRGHAAKLIADLPILIDVPVLTEPGIGAYVLTEQPDQASILDSGGTVERQTVVEARLIAQFTF